MEPSNEEDSELLCNESVKDIDEDFPPKTPTKNIGYGRYTLSLTPPLTPPRYFSEGTTVLKNKGIPFVQPTIPTDEYFVGFELDDVPLIELFLCEEEETLSKHLEKKAGKNHYLTEESFEKKANMNQKLIPVIKKTNPKLHKEKEIIKNIRRGKRKRKRPERYENECY